MLASLRSADLVRSNPLLLDPTRTTLIRTRFAADIRRRMEEVRSAIWGYLVTEDHFHKRKPKMLSFLAESDDKSEETAAYVLFAVWLHSIVESLLLSARFDSLPGGYWVTPYVTQAYNAGVRNSLALVGVPQVGMIRTAASAFLDPQGLPPALVASKTRQLSTRSYEYIRAMAARLEAAAKTEVANGLLQVDTPTAIARRINEKVAHLYNTSGAAIAESEIISAHAEGQLDAFQHSGIGRVGLRAEWVTVGDNRVCAACAAMEGQTFTIEEARGMIPLHPNCRCSWKSIT